VGFKVAAPKHGQKNGKSWAARRHAHAIRSKRIGVVRCLQPGRLTTFTAYSVQKQKVATHTHTRSEIGLGRVEGGLPFACTRRNSNKKRLV
jgi:hypothetical protein